MKIFRELWVQVLVAVALGLIVGAIWPVFGASLKPLGDAFVKLVKMAVAPVIFCTVAAGIAHMGDLKAVGRLGVRTLVYFEVMSTFALAVGLGVGELLHPGQGFNINPATLDPKAVADYAAKAAHGQGVVDYLMHLIPDTFLGAFANGDLLQVLVIAVLTGFACTKMGEFGIKTAGVLDGIAQVFFGIIGVIVRLAPIGAFGAMAYTIGKFGVASLRNLGALVGTFYLTSALFVLIVLGAVAALSGFSVLKFLRYIREELLIVLGASSSEAALPLIIAKLQRLGAGKTTVGLVVPTGYSFNLDGTNIYMTLATLFLAQATNIHLTWQQELTLLGVAMLTSKGASGVSGAGFITLAATLAVIPDLPIAALGLLLGVDRFMSQCRALTNFIGNGIGTLVIARWEGDLDRDKLRAELDRGPGGDPEALLEMPLA
ncbi:dicarboxylate/amino acid:cation symporter [Phenylobacterium sp.]|jgi:aerobic C4-dicarboxylate transport protein|uniref:dicarboxylate/amino acid:cation symporter n=1 Tax=Phenylobacterium sp. TaxID=1871053 RepID=UPI002E3345CC|nr:dicarboxylate/amino acid:cation symporter [Phenylobacterium sp.]HEX3365403.1 dicarboxylate/amino acid:cation symporter [Phenylobacterium sp.]